jgi:Ala-tRNA(Pro) deacylase
MGEARVMTIAPKLREALIKAGVTYEVVEHPQAPSASRTAEAAHAPGDRLAKGVLLQDRKGYLLAVVPSTHRLDFDALEHLLGRRLALAREAEVGRLFPDCEIGAVPPLGDAYRLDMMVSEGLIREPDVYLEAGDHRRLVRVSGADFDKLMAGARRGRFSHHT